MTRHPGNPYWDGSSDRPKAIFTRADWDAAEASGYITPEHVERRLANIVDYAFDTMTFGGFDEDGFYLSLVADGLAVPGGITMHVYGNDHPPPHAHITLKGDPRVNVRIDLTTGEFIGDPPRGLPGKKLRKFKTVVLENHELLAELWEKHHGETVGLS